MSQKRTNFHKQFGRNSVYIHHKRVAFLVAAVLVRNQIIPKKYAVPLPLDPTKLLNAILENLESRLNHTRSVE